jgi:hypothetical protein
VTALLNAPAPVTVVHQRVDVVELIDDALREALGRDSLRVYCTEAIETALRTGALAMADGRPVIWAYQPTRAATPVIWVAAQLPLVSTRTDPLDREELLSALLAWAVRPNLDRQALPGWLRGRLLVRVSDADPDATLTALQAEGVLDAQDRPQVERLSTLIDEWGLRAWVREARREDYG